MEDGRLWACDAPTLAGSSAYVGNEAPAAGVGLRWAHLAGVPPGPPNGSTAHGLGANDATELPLAHLVADLAEAWPSAVI